LRQVVRSQFPVVEVRFCKSGDGHEDDDEDVKTGEDIVEPAGKHFPQNFEMFYSSGSPFENKAMKRVIVF
jgi:hypothetical protein